MNPTNEIRNKKLRKPIHFSLALPLGFCLLKIMLPPKELFHYDHIRSAYWGNTIWIRAGVIRQVHNWLQIKSAAIDLVLCFT